MTIDIAHEGKITSIYVGSITDVFVWPDELRVVTQSGTYRFKTTLEKSIAGHDKIREVMKEFYGYSR
jgi:hypothetical protein